MNSEIPGWLTKGRNTKRSIAIASMTIMAIVMMSESVIGAKESFRISKSRTNVSAANRTIAPCAKLKTPEALKISTNQSATNE